MAKRIRNIGIGVDPCSEHRLVHVYAIREDEEIAEILDLTANECRVMAKAFLKAAKIIENLGAPDLTNVQCEGSA